MFHRFCYILHGTSRGITIALYFEPVFAIDLAPEMASISDDTLLHFDIEVRIDGWQEAKMRKTLFFDDDSDCFDYSSVCK